MKTEYINQLSKFFNFLKEYAYDRCDENDKKADKLVNSLSFLPEYDYFLAIIHLLRGYDREFKEVSNYLSKRGLYSYCDALDKIRNNHQRHR